MLKLFLGLWLLLNLNISSASWVDNSSHIFLPKQEAQTLTLAEDFSYFWWNLIIIENVEDKKSSFEKVNEYCRDLKRLLSGAYEQLICDNKLSDYKILLENWSQDSIYRTKAPSLFHMKESMNAALVKVSLSPSDALDLLRNDPFENYKDYVRLKERLLLKKYEKRDGFSYLPDHQYAIIPILLNYPPSDVSKTQVLLDHLSSIDSRLYLFGAHQVLYSNKNQVMKDSFVITLVGILLVLCFSSFFIFTKRIKVLVIFPVLLLASLLSVFGVIFLNGSIHAITLGFGVGIIGLAFDYGFHTAFTTQKERIWRSNLFGLLTTLAALACVMLSSLPLVRQMMLFACLGLTISFCCLYLVDQKFKILFQVPSFEKITFVEIKNRKMQGASQI